MCIILYSFPPDTYACNPEMMVSNRPNTIISVVDTLVNISTLRFCLSSWS